MALYIKKTRYFIGHKRIGLQLSRDDMAMAFSSKDQAMSFINSSWKKPYLLEAGEHQRPSYEIIEFSMMPEELKEFIRPGQLRHEIRKENADA